MEFTIKQLNECTLDEALTAWNTGFEGYYFDATMDIDRFTARIGQENLSASLSIVAFHGSLPIGILMSGVKTLNGKKVAWNGGTGVAAAYRRIGVGKQLIDRAIELYDKSGVELSTLEAISENKKAIALYKQRGYATVDEVVHLQKEEAPDCCGGTDYQAVFCSASDAPFFALYQHDTPWQSQWFCMKEAQALQLLDSKGETAAYGLFKRQYEEDGTLKSVVVTHCYVKEDRDNLEYLIDSLFSYLFPPSITKYQCTVAFFPLQNKIVYQYLINQGFTKKVSQVWMKKAVKQRVEQ